MSKTATGKTGECQICGRVQALVRTRNGGEVIARHGFALRGLGSTTRSCDGSGHYPAESGDLAAFDWPLERAARSLESNRKDLAEMTAPGYVWEAPAVPTRAINSRRSGIVNAERTIKYLEERRASIVARAARQGVTGGR